MGHLKGGISRQEHRTCRFFLEKPGLYNQRGVGLPDIAVPMKTPMKTPMGLR